MEFRCSDKLPKLLNEADTNYVFLVCPSGRQVTLQYFTKHSAKGKTNRNID